MHNLDSDEIVDQHFEVSKIFYDNKCIYMSDNDSATQSSDDDEEETFYHEPHKDNDGISKFINAFSNFNIEHLCESGIAV